MKRLKQILTVALLCTMLVITGCSTPTDEPQSSAPSSSQESEASTQEETTASDSTIILTDNFGREVELPYPVESAVVANRYNSELIRAWMEDFQGFENIEGHFYSAKELS